MNEKEIDVQLFTTDVVVVCNYFFENYLFIWSKFHFFIN